MGGFNAQTFGFAMFGVPNAETERRPSNAEFCDQYARAREADMSESIALAVPLDS